MGNNTTLLRFNDHSLPNNFVSIAVQIKKTTYEPFHAALLIRHKDINYLYHFPGAEPPLLEENFNESGWYIYKIIDFLSNNDSGEVGAFLQHCKRICDKSNITYGYIADGSRYDDRGDFISRIGLPEFGTCVGFCLNTLTTYIIDIDRSIIELDDWDDSEIIDWVDKMSLENIEKKYPDLDWTLYNAFKKRVTPLEYLCISFFDDYPIRKNDVDKIKVRVLDEINNIYN